ncbi:MAG: regulatory protein RecX [Candidatus Binatia bacterium]
MRGGTPEQALQHALKFLSYRARSEEEVRVKLTQLGFPEKSIKVTLERLRSLNVLNDEDFARGWAVRRAEGRGYGPVRIERELRQKGISKPLIDLILREAFAKDGERERARALLKKKFRITNLSDARVLRRAGHFLHRCGYHDSLIAELLSESLGEN